MPLRLGNMKIQEEALQTKCVSAKNNDAQLCPQIPLQEEKPWQNKYPKLRSQTHFTVTSKEFARNSPNEAIHPKATQAIWTDCCVFVYVLFVFSFFP